MHNIFTLLKSFTKVDIKKFYRFLSSSYFNTNEQIEKLFDELIRFYPKFSSTKLTKVYLYEKVYEKKIYKDSTLRNLLFRLERLIEMYYIIENCSNDKMSQFNLLLNHLNQKYIKDHFLKVAKSFESHLSNNFGTDYSYFYNKYLFEVNKYNFLSIHEKSTRKKEIKNQLISLEKGCIYLTIFFITEIICSYLNASTYEYRFKSAKISDTIKALVNSIDLKLIHKLIKDKDEEGFILNIYLNLFNCYSHLNKEKYYYTYKESVDKYSNKLSPDEISFHFSKLINYCIWQQDNTIRGEIFSHELFEIYQIFLERNYYKNSKIQYLPHNLFRAILFLSLKLKEFSWSEQFIDKFSSKVDPLHRENMYNFGYAFFHFHTYEYEKSHSYTNKILNDYFIFKFDVNSLLLRLNYHLFNPEEIHRVMHKYREALREDQLLPEGLKKSHLNFINFYNKLIIAAEGNKTIEIGLIREKLNASKNVIQKDWLINEYDLLIKKKTAIKVS